MLKPAEARDLLLDLRDAVTEDAPVEWSALVDRLTPLSGQDWLLLDHLARRPTWAEPAIVHGVRGWLGGPDEPAGVVAAVAALHVDGRVRERAVTHLGDRPGAISSSVLGLRLLDHVPEVRTGARAALTRLASTADHEAVLDVLLTARHRRHAAEQLAWLLTVTPETGEAGLSRLRTSPRRLVRRWAAEQSHERGLLTVGSLLVAADGDPDQWVRRRAADWLMSTPDPARLVGLLDSRSVDARLTAVTRLPDHLLDEQTLERLLLDRAPRVREQARWRARRRGLDLAHVLRQHLADNRTRAVLGALDGLAEIGSPDDAAAVVDLLRHPRPRVRAAAVRAVAARTPDAETTDLVAGLLTDPSGRVSSAAASVLARAGTPPELAEPAWASPLPTTRRAAWRLARSAGGWDRVAADLRAAADDDTALAELGRGGVSSWLRHGAATTWGRPPEGQARRMLAWLEDSGLGDLGTHHVAFHAGLTTTRAPIEPAPAPATPRSRSRLARWFRRR